MNFLKRFWSLLKLKRIAKRAILEEGASFSILSPYGVAYNVTDEGEPVDVCPKGDFFIFYLKGGKIRHKSVKSDGKKWYKFEEIDRMIKHESVS